MTRTGSNGAEHEGAAEIKRQQKAEVGVRTPRTGASGAEQAAGAAAPRTGTSGDEWRPDAQDWKIWDRTSSRARRPPDWIIRGQAAARRPGLEHPGRINQQPPPHPGLDHPGTSGGQTPRTESSRMELAAGAAAPRNGTSGDKRQPDAPGWIIRVGSSKESLPRGHDNPGPSGGQTPRTRSAGAEQKGAATTPRGWINPGNFACRPGQDCLGQIKQKGFPIPGLERPGESGGQRRKKQETKTNVVQRRSHVRKQRKGHRHGDALK